MSNLISRFKLLSILFLFPMVRIYSDTGFIVATPTADVLENRFFQMINRFENNGNFASTVNVGLFDFLELGTSFRIEKLVGVGVLKFEEPRVLVKIQFINETPSLPAFSIGWDATEKEFYSDNSFQLRKGFFIVLSKKLFQKEIFGLKVSGGLNSPMKEDYNGTSFFAGIICYLGKKLSFEFELDNFYSVNLLTKDNIDNDDDRSVDESDEEDLLRHFNAGISFNINNDWQLKFICLDINHDEIERNFAICLKKQF